ncbi:MAG: cytochrome C [Desulfurivibrionaceae bacterium]
MKRCITITSIFAFAMLTVLASCVDKGSMQQEGGEETPPPAQQEKVEASDKEVEARENAASQDDPYAVTPEPLTVAECGQCHPQVFKQVKNNGGKHRFECVNCHEQLHAYNPNEENWNEIMPKCSSCHTLPHGERFSNCLECHQNPHAPLDIISMSSISSECESCHQGPREQLDEYPSRHADLGCGTCHYSHGEIPSCFDCHEPHVPDQELSACKSCHPVHKPLEVAYDDSAEWNDTCSDCHDQVYTTWSETKSKHGQVNCGQCHISHGSIPDCQMCHDSPHDPNMLEKFPNCLECHIDPHDPPVKG